MQAQGQLGTQTRRSAEWALQDWSAPGLNRQGSQLLVLRSWSPKQLQIPFGNGPMTMMAAQYLDGPH